ncbi:type I-C CRISPR-associated protein Cas7/Csd2 [bacterium]|nr:type I-C CRISPR-associated protein Cas7/Csd2 [bacterium]
MNNVLKNRYEFVYLFDVENGNPNGDPDAGNMPRIDPETNHGLVTDVCLKRKIRNYVQLKKGPTEFIPLTEVYDPVDKKKECRVGHNIYVQEKAILNERHKEANTECKLPENKTERGKEENVEKRKKWMCGNYFDVRTFGAVMSTGDYNCGQVTGPVQFNFSRSIDPIMPLEITITRMAVTDRPKDDDPEKMRTMGRKHIVPYALYRMEGYISPGFADKTGFSDDDLKLLWESLENMFEHDRSAARGKMVARRLIVFKHDSALGNAPAHKLFELVKVDRKGDPAKPPRTFGDYEVIVEEGGLPQNVELEELL